ncbi:MAG: hypothetical protein A2015_12760 [Spirochaetes bacterium GWF1_31_7]|nr:MAG: hypothetical protein A2Y30_10550 [Spirochaetes bacterium GWE1_32_154]OHD49253.1 MAG: hypothetical protein A2Y29_16180 [Spirochaetes bacterium GWE2_31_10]OHD51815.1 MAG: hypothetical protein A2015_12760 [Spirochaetes bacterium GWF1_31_7]HBD95327.1 hypothetical protein [Spirochaetia bacterium]HBI39163.1 hypothetical protein [Spirochaetia bacterium]
MVKALKNANYTVIEATSGKEGISQLKNNLADLIVLDLNLGDMHGSDILRNLRKQNIYTPVIIVSTINEIDTKLDSFDNGCDDYLTKPFYMEELVARVKRTLHTNKNESAKIFKENVTNGPFMIDLISHKIYKSDTFIEAGNKLFNLFLYFMQNPDRYLSKEQIHNQVWDSDEDFNDNTISVHIHSLRCLIENDPKKPVYLRTAKNIGFIFSTH